MEYPQWSKGHKSWGRNYRIQRNVYAMRVANAMALAKYGTTGVCPCCGVPMDMTSNSAMEVDRVIPSLDYGTLGNIVYVCEACNQGRALLQRVGKDWRNVKRYEADVKRYSANVKVPAIREALTEWNDMRATRVSRVSDYA